MSDVVDVLSQLVAINSINPDLVPGAAGEAEIAAFVAGWLDDAGLDVEIDEPVTGRPSVVATAHGISGGRSLMLNAHLDTVGVAGMAHPFPPRIEGNKLFGRGAFDMKGGLAAIMLAAAQAKQLSLPGDVVLTAVADEEYASIGTQSVLSRWSADAAIVTEPTNLELCVAHKGFIWLDVETNGRAAHGSLPEQGIDAIVKMGRILVAIEDLDHSLRTSRLHPLLGSGSLHASLIEGGQELSSYPERCLLSLERRTVPGETQGLVESQIQSVIDVVTAADPQVRALLTTSLVREAFEVSRDEPIVQIVRSETSGVLGHEPRMVGETPWMDSAFLSAAGIPTVVIGPGGEGAHAIEEWVDLDSVQSCVRILVASIRTFCS